MAHGIDPSHRLRPRAGIRHTGPKGVRGAVGPGVTSGSGDRVGKSMCRFTEAGIPLTARDGACTLDRGAFRCRVAAQTVCEAHELADFTA